MKDQITFLAVLFFINIIYSQQTKAFQDGEMLRFKMSYSGFLKAGEAEISLKEETFKGKKILHATALGKTSSIIGWFFKVRDDYQSFFDIESGLPYLFKRKINEGGYKKNKTIAFNNVEKQAKVKDIIKGKETSFSGVYMVQDMISVFYFLRNQDIKNMKINDEIAVDVFFDEEKFPFKLKLLGEEIIRTKFGKVKTKKFRPLVAAGRVFKENESVSIWITADDNKIPMKLQADLVVGSLRAELNAYEGLANPFQSFINKK